MLSKQDFRRDFSRQKNTWLAVNFINKKTECSSVSLIIGHFLLCNGQVTGGKGRCGFIIKHTLKIILLLDVSHRLNVFFEKSARSASWETS